MLFELITCTLLSDYLSQFSALVLIQIILSNFKLVISDSPVVTIASFAPQLVVITSKQRPRKLTIHGSDGKDYAFLLKGHEDLRQDERVMQVSNCWYIIMLCTGKRAPGILLPLFIKYLVRLFPLFLQPRTKRYTILLLCTSCLVWLILCWRTRERLQRKIYQFNDMMSFHCPLIVD